MRIITISREFGSGGRELGKRLADLLKFDYYDKEIIEALIFQYSDAPTDRAYFPFSLIGETASAYRNDPRDAPAPYSFSPS